MIRNVGALIAVLILGISIGAAGWLLGSSPSGAQEGPVAVSAVATDWITSYEVDPFDRTQLRRSTVSVSRIAVVWSDGHTEERSVGK